MKEKKEEKFTSLLSKRSFLKKQNFGGMEELRKKWF